MIAIQLSVLSGIECNKRKDNNLQDTTLFAILLNRCVHTIRWSPTDNDEESDIKLRRGQERLYLRALEFERRGQQTFLHSERFSSEVDTFKSFESSKHVLVRCWVRIIKKTNKVPRAIRSSKIILIHSISPVHTLEQVTPDTNDVRNITSGSVEILFFGAHSVTASNWGTTIATRRDLRLFP